MLGDLAGDLGAVLALDTDEGDTVWAGNTS
ncbi:Uncharacterised protein [Mycobacteroides abscessus subsp. massiliense]|nr:Uncharacterised protein [Mycobacteroides abscessus subsp. massiliense]